MTLGRHSYFLGIDEAGDSVCGHFTSVGKGVTIQGPDNHPCIRDPRIVTTFDMGSHFGKDSFPLSGYSKGRVTIGNDVWVGEQAKILTGVTIHDGAIIAAHTVVTKDVPPYALVAGNPGRVRKYRFSPEQIYHLLAISWWAWDDDKIREALPAMHDIDEFLTKYSV